MRVKICGVTRLSDAEMAVEAGAWAVGLNNVESSARRCEPDEAAQIGAALKRRAMVAGIFANHTLDEVEEMADQQQLSMLQLHGDEGPSFCAEIAGRTGCQVAKAVRVKSNADVQAAAVFHTDFILFDAYSPNALGGTGETFDWELLRDRHSGVPTILGGGLTPDNVADAIRAVHPFAVDVASGVESAPGIKDADLVERFIAAADAEAATTPAPTPASDPSLSPTGEQA